MPSGPRSFLRRIWSLPLCPEWSRQLLMYWGLKWLVKNSLPPSISAVVCRGDGAFCSQLYFRVLQLQKGREWRVIVSHFIKGQRIRALMTQWICYKDDEKRQPQPWEEAPAKQNKPRRDAPAQTLRKLQWGTKGRRNLDTVLEEEFFRKHLFF